MRAGGWLVLALPLLTAAVGAHEGDGAATLVLKIALILVLAKLGGDVAVRLRQPAVLGELCAGVLLGNLLPLGIPHGVTWLTADPSLEMLAQLGILLLLFEAGLESTVGQMLGVGRSSLLVALLGVAAPFALGYGTSALLLPDRGPYVHAFIGATLSATSVGITVRVLRDLAHDKTPEARVILGAAVIDDVLGLVILAGVSGAITTNAEGGGLPLSGLLFIFVKAVIFLTLSLFLGVLLSRRLFHLASLLQSRGVLLSLGLSFCFLLSYLANRIGLAPLVGAFAAGLILEDVHYRPFTERGEHALEELVHPITAFLSPIFFVLMGLHTDLSAFAQPGVLLLGSLLILAAIAGKMACALGVVQPGTDRLSVGIGMIPRGEVGLIFASIGQRLQVGGAPVISRDVFSAVVMMVIVTTLITPPALSWSLRRRAGAARAPSPQGPQGREQPELI